tara:strand:+ start:11832 stop:12479 length:648 start_codon:yes stop_codon:yes gene_type:complete
MSFTRLKYDTGAYKLNINQAAASANYEISKPRVASKQCYPHPTTQHLEQHTNVLREGALIDTHSDLLGITRRHSKDPRKKYTPPCQTLDSSNGYPCGGGAVGPHKSGPGTQPEDHTITHWRDTITQPESTRLSNPACNVRGTGWNRWEWLCSDPQDQCIMPFDSNVSNRIIAKDNHRPIIPVPAEVTNVVPGSTLSDCDAETYSCVNFTAPPIRE